MSRPDMVIVDDEPDFAAFVATVAEGMGFAVRLAESGMALRRLYGERRPDLVMLDIVMPDEDGIEVARWLHEAAYAGGLILISGHNPLYLKMAAVLRELAGERPPVILRKPIRLAELRAAMQPWADT
ncbi:response regulator [Marinibaculum pumilum]|uniref:Response regulator n=1 Tax=Marinibaculum pumilum TaxID=1766165 RepID=A0ABV7L2T5_9PROT